MLQTSVLELTNVCDISHVMSQHPWTEAGLENLSSSGMFTVVTSSSLLQSSNSKVLVAVIEPSRASWIVRQEEEKQERAEECNNALIRVSSITRRIRLSEHLPR